MSSSPEYAARTEAHDAEIAIVKADRDLRRAHEAMEQSLEHAQELMETCKAIHDLFWAAKGREVAYYTAS